MPTLPRIRSPRHQVNLMERFFRFTASVFGCFACGSYSSSNEVVAFEESDDENDMVSSNSSNVISFINPIEVDGRTFSEATVTFQCIAETNEDNFRPNISSSKGIAILPQGERCNELHEENIEVVHSIDKFKADHTNQVASETRCKQMADSYWHTEGQKISCSLQDQIPNIDGEFGIENLHTEAAFQNKQNQLKPICTKTSKANKHVTTEMSSLPVLGVSSQQLQSNSQRSSILNSRREKSCKPKLTEEQHQAINRILLGDAEMLHSNRANACPPLECDIEIQRKQTADAEKKEKKLRKARKKLRKKLEKNNAWAQDKEATLDNEDRREQAWKATQDKYSGNKKTKEDANRRRKNEFNSKEEDKVKKETKNGHIEPTMLLPGAAECDYLEHVMIASGIDGEDKSMMKGEAQKMVIADIDMEKCRDVNKTLASSANKSIKNKTRQIQTLKMKETEPEFSSNPIYDKAVKDAKIKSKDKTKNEKDAPTKKEIRCPKVEGSKRRGLSRNNKIGIAPLQTAVNQPTSSVEEFELSPELREFFDPKNRPTTRQRPPERGEAFSFGLMFVEVPMTPPEIVPNKEIGHCCLYEDYLTQLHERSIRAMTPESRNRAIEEENERKFEASCLKERLERSDRKQKAEQERRQRERSWAEKFTGGRRRKSSRQDNGRMIFVQPINQEDEDSGESDSNPANSGILHLPKIHQRKRED